MKKAQEVLDELLGGVSTVRDYLRGIDEGSETDRDAQRSMLAAIDSLRSAGVYDAMAEAAPEQFAQACLLLCRMWTDAEDGVSEKLLAQYNALALQLRYDERNNPE